MSSSVEPAEDGTRKNEGRFGSELSSGYEDRTGSKESRGGKGRRGSDFSVYSLAGSDEGGSGFGSCDFLGSLTYNGRYYVLGFWAVVAVVCMGFAGKLVDNVTLIDWSSPPGTPSEQAAKDFAEHFALMMDAKTETVLVKCAQPCETVVGELSKGIVDRMRAIIEGFDKSYPGTVVHHQSYYSYGDALDPNPLLSLDKQGLLFQWTWHVNQGEITHAADVMVEELMQEVDRINADLADLIHAGATGPTVLKRAVMLTMAEDMSYHDALCLPFALCILSFRIKSFKLLPLPLICIFLSVICSFAMTYAYSMIGPVSQLAPTIMILLCVALSMDYSLFMLSRYVEERINGREVEEALNNSLNSSGTVVFLSGTVLMVAYGAMLYLPGAVKSVSFGACASILCCILIQVTFLPAIVAAVPFFHVYDNPDFERRERSDTEITNGSLTDGDQRSRYQAMHAVPRGRGESSLSAAGENDQGPDPVVVNARPFGDSLWFAWGGVLTKYPVNIIVPLVLNILFFPATIRFMQYKPSIDFPQTIPQHRHAWLTNLEIQREFSGGMGCSFPIFIMSALEGKEGIAANETEPEVKRRWYLPETTQETRVSQNDIRTQAFFEANCRMANALIEATKGHPYELQPENFLSVTFHNGRGEEVVCNNYAQRKWFRTSFFTRGISGAKISEELWMKSVSKGHHAVITLLYPKVDIFSADAFELVRRIRKFLVTQTDKESGLFDTSGVTFTTHSATGVLMDNVDTTMQRLPWSFGVTVFLSFVVIAFTFGAMFIPVKLLFTVGLPITWTYGCALFVYADGWLDFTGAEGLTNDGGMMWLSPVCTCTVLLGLALDYDIFLFARVWEFRQEGFSDVESIQLGLSATGPIITSAGLIFGITFSGMLMSQIPLNNQLGFIFVFGLLSDTFLVRTALVPSILSFFPILNWWPMAMPKPERTTTMEPVMSPGGASRNLAYEFDADTNRWVNVNNVCP